MALLTAPDSIAWLLNVRGGDVPRTPFALGFALLHTDGHVDLYMDRRKVPDRTVAWLGNAVTLAPPEELGAAHRHAGQGRARSVLIETSTAPVWAATRLQAAGSHHGARRRSVRAAQGLQERRRARGHPRRPSPRRRRGHALPRLARAPSPRADTCARSRSPTGCRRCARRPASCATSPSTPSPAPGPNGAIVHYHATDGDRADARAGLALSGRFRRPVSRRHHRHHPHRRRSARRRRR